MEAAEILRAESTAEKSERKQQRDQPRAAAGEVPALLRWTATASFIRRLPDFFLTGSAEAIAAGDVSRFSVFIA